MPTHRIALYPGDGIGPEVIDAAVPVLDRVAALNGGVALSWTRFDWGAGYHGQHGVVAPADFLEQLRGFDAILLGAVGWPATLPDAVTLSTRVAASSAPCDSASTWPGRGDVD
jgi:tartrate dehydrogenase/decarboxylase/D-malate dehydrogenase